MCGFSMGGVHACMAASLYPGPVACVPLMAPRSAAAAFCHGALREATAWQPLVAAADEAQKVSPQPLRPRYTCTRSSEALLCRRHGGVSTQWAALQVGVSLMSS